MFDWINPVKYSDDQQWPQVLQQNRIFCCFPFACSNIFCLYLSFISVNTSRSLERKLIFALVSWFCSKMTGSFRWSSWLVCWGASRLGWGKHQKNGTHTRTPDIEIHFHQQMKLSPLMSQPLLWNLVFITIHFIPFSATLSFPLRWHHIASAPLFFSTRRRQLRSPSPSCNPSFPLQTHNSRAFPAISQRRAHAHTC